MEEQDQQNRAFEKRLKRQVIGKPHRFLAVVPLGFEQTFIREFNTLGIQTTICDTGSAQASNRPQVVGDGKVEFTAKITEAWKAVAYTRVANRIMMHIADFKAENFRDLEKKASEIPWELYLPCHPEQDAARHRVEGSISIHVTCKHSRLYHSDAVAERLQKVIKGGSVPLAPADAASATPSAGTPRNAPQNLYVTLIDDRCTLWLDLAGEELYKRGHERFVNDAPLKETIAAGMILESIEILRLRAAHSAQDDTAPANITLIDPMAGSGTFSLEAAYMASGLIPGKCRDFALKHQPAFKPATWNHIVKQESVILSETPNGVESKNLFAKILTSDISERAVNIIRHNIECSPLAQSMTSEQPATGAHSLPTNNSTSPAINIVPQLRDFFTYTAKEIADACHTVSQPVIVLNPPYGKRLDFDAPALYTRIGKKLAELARELEPFGKKLTVAILAPNDDPRPGSKFTCTANLLRECPALDPANNPSAKLIATSHGGLGLGAFIAQI